ncbi:MAG: hypothetical protein M1828_000480 [Chrysothrix sp. TS-e1954]|nr:MAG: hypothetical protein M1828_000480 [Chrysothrix sp. TS-e1954]
MAFATAAALAASAAYLDAKFFISHDLQSMPFAYGQRNLFKYIASAWQSGRYLTYHVIEDHALQNRPDQVFLVFEGKSWTYRQFYDDVQKVGNWLMNDLGIKKREVVAVNGANSPGYLMLWFALEGIGAVPSLINCNLTSKPLLHCVKVCEARYMLVDEDVKPLVSPCASELQGNGTKVLYYVTDKLCALPLGDQIPYSRQAGLGPEETGLLMFTSGTTGNPKAVVLRRGRCLNTGHAIAWYLKLKATDRMYTCMPMYHGTANALCMTPTIHAGSSVAMSKKFSHKTFWPEICQSKANILQYVGELCRYALNAPPSQFERAHQLEMAWGNGMRPDVWEPFRQRFGIETIHELYAATDGMGSTYNRNRGDFTRGAIGKRGLLWNTFIGSKEVRARIDTDTGDLVRDENGFAQRCSVNEPGESLHKMDPATVEIAFAGYFNNKVASQKRFVTDAFQKGDLWFRSGDMMRQDRDGRAYFVDRLGDTFRWKSENVSTNEISDVLGEYHQIAEANVYGVEVPKADGRCGCAAIVFADGFSEDAFDFHRLAAYALEILPRYAVPIFLRITTQLDYTGTAKLQKTRLRQEGIDPSKMGSDRMYWLPMDATTYRPFTQADFDDLKIGRARL